MIGFVKPSGIPRIPVRNEQGVKVGYLAYRNGKQEFQNVHGKTILTNVRFKKSFTYQRASGCGGSFIPEGY